jgi:NAD(P)H dehydrogenase (quinone)
MFPLRLLRVGILKDVNTLLIVCHPDEHSFSHAVGQRVEAACISSGGEITRHNLYDERFDPILSKAELARQYSFEPLVQRYAAEARVADQFVFVHPDWWSGPPALLKGWIDRVFRPGIAYDWVGEEFADKHHEPLLTGRTASVFISTDRPADDPPEALRLFWTDLFAYAGITLTEFTVFPDFRHSSTRQRREWLAEVESTARSTP